MIEFEFVYVPLADWPGKRTQKPLQRAPFAVTYEKTLAFLGRELRHLGADKCVFEVDVQQRQIRLDGRLRNGETVASPGIIVSFQSKHGPLRVACDRFQSNEDNLRAITLHLEHLRLASLYGVGESGEQYKGWLRLGAGAPIALGAMTVEEAAGYLSSFCDIRAGLIIDGVMPFREAYRVAARKAHPDSPLGTEDQFEKVQRARAVLDAHHGITKNAGGGQ